MKDKTNNALSIFIKASMPVIAIAGLILGQFVTFGAKFSFGVTDTTKMILSAVALFFFYMPIRDIFLQTFNGSQKTKDKKDAYQKGVDFVCADRTKAFKEYCLIEYEERKEKTVNTILRNTEHTFISLREKYKFDADLVKSDTELSKRDRRALLRAICEERKIKPENVDTILPSGKHVANNHRRVRSNPERLSARTLTVKSITSVISCVAFVSIGLSLVEGTTAVEIITTVVMLVGLCLWQMFSAFTAARQINNEYLNELSEKTMFLLEFEEHIEHHPVQAAAMPSAVNVPYVRRDTDLPEENPNYILTLTKK